MPGDLRTSPNFITRFLRFFFFLIYEPFAWSYDLVAWIVSLGRWNSWVTSTLPELPGPRVLELGYGPGHLQLALRQKGIRAFGIDRSAPMGRIARRRLRRAKVTPDLVRAKAEHLPFPTSAFDQLVATFPSEYIIQPATLSEIKRLLANNGKVLILPVAWIRGNKLWDRAAAWLFRATGQAPEWNKAFSDPLRQAGFSVEQRNISLPGSDVILLVSKPVS